MKASSVFLSVVVLSILLIGNASAATDLQTTFTNMVAKVILGMLLLAGITFGTKWLMESVIYGTSLIDPVKYLILFIIWLVVFLIMFFVLAGYIMTNWYPST